MGEPVQPQGSEASPVSGKASAPWTRALDFVAKLPKKHQPIAFICVLLLALGLTFGATLVSKSGLEFLQGAPIVAFVVFLIGTLALVTQLKPASSNALVGLFYFLPLLYAVLVFGLALIQRPQNSDMDDFLKSQAKLNEDNNAQLKQLVALYRQSESEMTKSERERLVEQMVEASRRSERVGQIDVSTTRLSHRGTEVVGIVRDKLGAPIQDVEVHIVDENTGMLASVRTDEKGQYHLVAEKTPGPVTIIFSAGSRLNRVETGLASGKVHQFDIEL